MPCVLNLNVRDRRAKRARPVDRTVAPRDQPSAVQSDKCFVHSGRKPRVHRKDFAAPCHRSPEFPELFEDLPGVSIFPGPDFVQKLVAAEVMPR